MSSKGTLLIFAYECYPYHRTASTIGAQRPYQFAKHLATMGWKVIVLCSDHTARRTIKHQDVTPLVNSLYAFHQSSLKEENLTVVPLPSLQFYGLSDYIWSTTVTKGEGDVYIGKPFPYSVLRKVTTVYHQLRNGDYSSSWVPVAKAFAEIILKDHPVNIILGEHSPDAGIILADWCSRKYNIPWVADFRDPVLWPFKGLLHKLYKPVVKKIVASASATISVNSYWASLDKALFGKPSYTVINGYDEELFSRVTAHSFSSFTVSYFGSISGQFQDVQPSLDAFAAFLKKHRDVQDIVLFYRGLHDKQFYAHCQRAGIPDQYLDVSGFEDRTNIVAYMKGSHVLLIYSIPPYKSKSIYEIKGFYPGKIFEYIGAETPILLYPSDQGMLASLIEDQKKGRACHQEEEAIHFFEEAYQKWKMNHAPAPAGDADTTSYSRQTQAALLDTILDLYKKK